MMSILPMLKTELERNFSLSNRIKPHWRNRLAPSTVSDLMTVKPSEVNFEFNPTPAISVWLESSKCGRRPHIMQHGKHAKKYSSHSPANTRE